MKLIDADALKKKYPDRKSLNYALDQAEQVNVSENIQSVKTEMCDKYCKIPYKFSAAEWAEIITTDKSPCNRCPLDRL